MSKILLSHQQKYILRVLENLGCVRLSQLHELTKSEFSAMKSGITEGRMVVMLRQLIRGNYDIVLDNGVVRMGNVKVDPLALEAIDVMLEITDRCPAGFTREKESNVLLRFYERQIYTVMRLTTETMPKMEEISPKREERIIWLSESLKSEDCQNIPERQFFAQKGEDGVYHFYH